MKILVNDFAGHPFQLELSRTLARAGHTVLHAYFGANNTPKGEMNRIERGLGVESISIGRAFEKHSLYARRAADVAYGNALRSRILAFCPQIVISANTPLDAQRILLDATHACGGRFVFWMQDLLSVGVEFALRKKRVPLARAAGYFYGVMERRLLARSDAVICIAPEFLPVLNRWKIDAAKVSVIENWAPLEEMPCLPRSNSWSREQDIDGKLCFMYSGTLGMKHKPELLLELARHFEAHRNRVIVVNAEGVGADWLRERQGLLRPGALRVLPFQPYARLPEVLASADVLVALLDEKCGAFAVPSKTLTYLCAGRPILIAAPAANLAARMVQSAGAGLAVNPHADEFLRAATRLVEEGEARSRYGSNARQYAERTFDMDRICRDFLAVFAVAADNALGSPPARFPANAATD
jgi:glycosyltransferase involved in cell wall biosynthesis